MTEDWGDSYMHVAVHRAKTTLTAIQSFDAKNEIQIIDFRAAYKDEVQVTFNILDYGLVTL